MRCATWLYVFTNNSQMHLKMAEELISLAIGQFFTTPEGLYTISKMTIVFVFHQNEVGNGKSIPNAQEMRFHDTQDISQVRSPRPLAREISRAERMDIPIQYSTNISGSHLCNFTQCRRTMMISNVSLLNQIIARHFPI